MTLEGRLVRLRAVEPGDLDTLLAWENDTDVWPVSGTTEPFSRRQMEHFIEEQQDAGVFRAGQLRLMIETRADGRAVGAIDLFDVDPLHRRAGVGILIHLPDDRSRGFAAEALDILCGYARRTLHLHQLWCGIETDNEASLRLFRRAGFVPCGVRRDWTWHPDGFRDEATMQKMLE